MLRDLVIGAIAYGALCGLYGFLGLRVRTRAGCGSCSLAASCSANVPSPRAVQRGRELPVLGQHIPTAKPTANL